MSEMTTKLKNIERFEDLELGSIRILNSAIAYLTQLESENAALKSRLEEVERERDAALKDIHKSCGTCIHGAARIYGDEQPAECITIHGCGNKNWQWRGAQVDGGGE